jgi:hypothetical protein
VNLVLHCVGGEIEACAPSMVNKRLRRTMHPGDVKQINLAETPRHCGRLDRRAASHGEAGLSGTGDGKNSAVRAEG